MSKVRESLIKYITKKMQEAEEYSFDNIDDIVYSFTYRVTQKRIRGILAIMERAGIIYTQQHKKKTYYFKVPQSLKYYKDSESLSDSIVNIFNCLDGINLTSNQIIWLLQDRWAHKTPSEIKNPLTCLEDKGIMISTFDNIRHKYLWSLA